MLDLSRFSDLFSQLTPGFRPGSLFGQRPAPATEPGTPKGSDAPETFEAPKDILDISRLISDQPSASFDRVGAESALPPPPVSVAEDGIYQPTQVQHRLSKSLNFSFSMSLQHATVVQRPTEPGGAVSRAMESTKFAYQLQSSSSRREIGSSYSELRQFQSALFYSRNRSLSQTLGPETGQHLESTGRSVARRFEIEISMDFSFLRQYNVQTESLAGDEDVLTQYLNGVDGLTGRSGEALQAFFDEVDNILANTEAFVQDKLGSFLTDVQAAFGLNNAETNDFVAQVADEVSAFFDEIDSFLTEARGSLSGSTLEPESGEAELALV